MALHRIVKGDEDQGSPSQDGAIPAATAGRKSKDQRKPCGDAIPPTLSLQFELHYKTGWQQLR